MSSQKVFLTMRIETGLIALLSSISKSLIKPLRVRVGMAGLARPARTIHIFPKRANLAAQILCKLMLDPVSLTFHNFACRVAVLRSAGAGGARLIPHGAGGKSKSFSSVASKESMPSRTRCASTASWTIASRKSSNDLATRATCGRSVCI